MKDFKPPRGQSCANCCAWDEIEEDALGKCKLLPGEQTPETFNDGWCLHWRPSADMRCGGCEHFAEKECPRVALGNNCALVSTPSAEAFACERWEATP